MTKISGSQLDHLGLCCVSTMNDCHFTMEDLFHPMDVKKSQIQIKCLLPADKVEAETRLVKPNAISHRIEQRILKNIYYELSQHATHPGVKPSLTHLHAFMRWDSILCEMETAEQVVDKLFKYNGARIKLQRVRKGLTIMLQGVRLRSSPN